MYVSNGESKHACSAHAVVSALLQTAVNGVLVSSVLNTFLVHQRVARAQLLACSTLLAGMILIHRTVWMA